MLAILSIALCIALQCDATGHLKLSDVLQSNMVIQQGKPFKVWGTAQPYDKVSVFTDWNVDTLVVSADQHGFFTAIINVPMIKKGDYTPHLLNVSSSSGERVKLQNLLIGDVWFCGGQSNMQFAVKEVPNAEQELKAADFPGIRIFSAGLNFSDTPIANIKGEWKECSPKVARDFSAVGYFFARKLHEHLDIPIGVIFSGIGASAVQAYVPKNVLAADELLNKHYLEPYLQSAQSREKVDGGFSFEKVTRPYLLYNAMIHPFINLSITGFCWYQGEANHFERENYIQATKVLIHTWRKLFAQGPLPFYYIQIAPFYHDKENPALAFDAFFREAQEKVLEVANTGMVVSMDVGEAKDLHPKNKKPLGERLANMALNRNYGFEDIAYLGPHYKCFDISGRKAIISFEPESISGGLTTSDNQAPAFFYIAGKDKVFHPATAAIKGDKIWVTSKSVRKPVAVRYAFFNYPVTNLQNGKGLPAVPFRTDNWEEVK